MKNGGSRGARPSPPAPIVCLPSRCGDTMLKAFAFISSSHGDITFFIWSVRLSLPLFISQAKSMGRLHTAMTLVCVAVAAFPVPNDISDGHRLVAWGNTFSPIIVPLSLSLSLSRRANYPQSAQTEGEKTAFVRVAAAVAVRRRDQWRVCKHNGRVTSSDMRSYTSGILHALSPTCPILTVNATFDSR